VSALKLHAVGKATKGRSRSEPDSGKPTIRDRRGACGNVNLKLWIEQPTRSSRVRRGVTESQPSSILAENCAHRISTPTFDGEHDVDTKTY